MDFNKLCAERYSVRKFSQRKIEPAQLESLLRAAQLAPTAVNRQPFKIAVVQSDEAREALRECTPYHFDAPLFIVVAALPELGWTRKSDQHPYAGVDASIVATHIMMQAHELGLGTTWVGYLDAPLMQEKFPSLKDTDIVAVFPIGYPAEDAEPSARHFERKSLDELVEYL